MKVKIEWIYSLLVGIHSALGTPLSTVCRVHRSTAPVVISEKLLLLRVVHGDSNSILFSFPSDTVINGSHFGPKQQVDGECVPQWNIYSIIVFFCILHPRNVEYYVKPTICIDRHVIAVSKCNSAMHRNPSISRSSASLNNTEIVKPFVLCVKSAHTWVNLWEIGVQRPIEWMKARFTAFWRFRTILCRRRYFIMFVWELRCATWPSDNCNMDRHNTRAGA